MTITTSNSQIATAGTTALGLGYVDLARHYQAGPGLLEMAHGALETLSRAELLGLVKVLGGGRVRVLEDHHGLSGDLVERLRADRLLRHH